MSILPDTSALTLSAAAPVYADATWSIDWDAGRTAGLCDGQAALLQAIALRLLTERYAYPIYSGDYGSELYTLIGGEPETLRGAVPRLIGESLLRDERIAAVRDVTVDIQSDAATIRFTAVDAAGGPLDASVNVQI